MLPMFCVSELGEAKNARVKTFADRFEKRLAARDRADESQARALVRELSCPSGALLVRHAPAEVADAFCASRLDGEGAPVFGLLPRGLDMRGIAERAGPAN